VYKKISDQKKPAFSGKSWVTGFNRILPSFCWLSNLWFDQTIMRKMPLNLCKSSLYVCNLRISRLKLAKPWWKNPVFTRGGSNRLVGFRNTEKIDDTVQWTNNYFCSCEYKNGTSPSSNPGRK